jgi:beta-N-acetylhexosaminidase
LSEENRNYRSFAQSGNFSTLFQSDYVFGHMNGIGYWKAEIAQRIPVIVALLICSSFQVKADPQPDFFAADTAVIKLAQAETSQPKLWQHSDDSQRVTLSIKDCASYGSEYGYPECEGIPRLESEEKLPSGRYRRGFPLSSYFDHFGPRMQATPLPNLNEGDRTEHVVRKPRTLDASPVPKRESRVLTDRTLRKIVRELIIVAFDGQSPPEAGLNSILTTLRAGDAGGVLLRGSNIKSPSQLRALTALLKEASEAPLVIAIERPGAGIAYPSKPGFRMFPTPREMGRKDDALAAFNAYIEMAKELSSVGVNMNIGPNANVCPKDAPASFNRCFSSIPRHAAAFASAFNFAHADRQVLTAMRFQPSVEKDASLDMMRAMVNSRAPDALIIGIDKAQYILDKMIIEAQDSIWKAGFRGTVIYEISDESKKQSVSNALVLALEAGGDMVLLSSPREHQANIVISTVKALRLAMSEGRVSMDRIINAYQYAQRLKKQLRMWEELRLGEYRNFTSSTGRKKAR